MDEYANYWERKKKYFSPPVQELIQYWFDKTTNRRDIEVIVSSPEDFHSVGCVLNFALGDEMVIPKEMIFAAIASIEDEPLDDDLPVADITEYMQEIYGETVNFSQF